MGTHPRAVDRMGRPGHGLRQEGHLPRASTCSGPIYDTNII